MPEQSAFEEIAGLTTEARNPATVRIDSCTTRQILELINREDRKVARVVAKQILYIEQAVKLIVQSLKKGGRLFYVGAGTSGRLGVLDASECPPTFGTPPDMVQGIIAGGYDSLLRSSEGVEDRFEAGADDIKQRGIAAEDVVVGIAASKRTPYVLGALGQAREMGAGTVLVTCNPRNKVKVEVDVAICPVVGPEVIMGSTRMKAGTAEKLILNMLTTTSMIRLGKVYGNLMVDLQATSQKLVERSKRVIMIATGLDYNAAAKLLDQAGGNVKTALVMALASVDRKQAQRRLKEGQGFVARALGPGTKRKVIHTDVDKSGKS